MEDVKKHDVHINYCPNCSGVWLDSGEIDKIVQQHSSTSEVSVDGTAGNTPSHIFSSQKIGYFYDLEFKSILEELRREGRIS
jgi:Zn-finger nucleic acid-binding protein